MPKCICNRGASHFTPGHIATGHSLLGPCHPSHHTQCTAPYTNNTRYKCCHRLKWRGETTTILYRKGNGRLQQETRQGQLQQFVRRLQTLILLSPSVTTKCTHNRTNILSSTQPACSARAEGHMDVTLVGGPILNEASTVLEKEVATSQNDAHTHPTHTRISMP
jgi:hypothetical protein